MTWGGFLLSNSVPTRAQVSSSARVSDTSACRADLGLTRALTPRDRVRTYLRDATGHLVNTTRSTPLTDVDPTEPFAIYLADTNRRFHLLAFDLDAKTGTKTARAAVTRDVDQLVDALTTLRLEHLVCASGPTGGRHVWIRFAQPVDAATVADIARLTRHLCPTLDISPLTNPATGCVRPPGAPHLAGGHSQIIAGDIAALLAPTHTRADARRLLQHLARLVDDTAAAEPAVVPDAGTPLPVDQHGHVHLPGPRRALGAAADAALRAPIAGASRASKDGEVVADASAVLWQILIGAAAARWRHRDIAQLVDTAPGLEHVRTERVGGRRTPRPTTGPNAKQSSPSAILRRQWRKAVHHVAARTRAAPDRQHNPAHTTSNASAAASWAVRTAAIAAHVDQVQTRADAAPGRWTHRTGPTDRRVLDVLCVLALQAVTTNLEADTRRVALLAGIGRETARTGLLRLAADGWIARIRDAEGPHGAHWTIAPPTPDDHLPGDLDTPVGMASSSTTPLIHRPLFVDRSQADPPPSGTRPTNIPPPAPRAFRPPAAAGRPAAAPADGQLAHGNDQVDQNHDAHLGHGPALRTVLLTALTTRLSHAVHDLFTQHQPSHRHGDPPGTRHRPGGIGHHAGNLYARLDHSPTTAADLARTTGGPTLDDIAATTRELDRLVDHGLLIRDDHGYRHPARDRRTTLATTLGVTGRLADRARTYALERELWTWWQGELDWMRAPSRPPASRRPGPGQLSLAPDHGTHAFGPYPRALGRANHREARRIVADERNGKATRRRHEWTRHKPTTSTGATRSA